MHHRLDTAILTKLIITISLAFTITSCASGRTSPYINPTKDDIPKLLKALEHNDRMERAYAASALREIGVDAKVAVPALMKALDDKEWIVRLDAANALGEMFAYAEAALPKLRYLAENDPYRFYDPYTGDWIYSVRVVSEMAIKKITSK
jgi:hypothetical protein